MIYASRIFYVFWSRQCCCWALRFFSLPLSWRRSLSQRNQPIDLLCKLMDWFLYDRDLRHERPNKTCSWSTLMKVFGNWEYSKLVLFLRFWSSSTLNFPFERSYEVPIIFALPFINRLFKAVAIKLWWSEIPSSKTLEFLKNYFLFVKICTA